MRSKKHECWSTPKNAALNISESRKRTIKRRRIVKEDFSSGEESDIVISSGEENEMHTPPSSGILRISISSSNFGFSENGQSNRAF